METSSKKRKVEENGAAILPLFANLTPEDVRKIIESFNQEQLMDIVAEGMCRDEGILNAVRQIADRDLAQRKLFIRGLGWETTTEKIRSVFSSYGELAEAVIILDKVTGRSKGYGFITLRHVDGALLALKEPNKKIDGRMTVTQLAAAGATGPAAPAPTAADVSLRKIYVGNVPTDMHFDRLRALFSSYGEIEEGPLGFDKQLGKFKGYALFIYKTVEATQAALVEPIKSIDGITLQCTLATDGKKGRSGVIVPGVGVLGKSQGGTGPDGHADGLGMGSQSSMPGSFSSQFGGPGGGLSSYGGLSASGGFPVAAAGGQAPSSLGSSGVGGYVGGGMSGGPFGSSQYPVSGGYGGFGMGSSLYRMPAGSAGMPASGFPEGGPYSSSSMYQAQHHQPAGSSPGPRIPSVGGMYHNAPHYF